MVRRRGRKVSEILPYAPISTHATGFSWSIAVVDHPQVPRILALGRPCYQYFSDAAGIVGRREGVAHDETRQPTHGVLKGEDVKKGR